MMAGDIDGDGDEDLFVTNLDNEGNTLYLNHGKGLYADRSSESGLAKLDMTGFGIGSWMPTRRHRRPVRRQRSGERIRGGRRRRRPYPLSAKPALPEPWRESYSEVTQAGPVGTRSASTPRGVAPGTSTTTGRSRPGGSTTADR